jgi:hypothetical protein
VGGVGGAGGADGAAGAALLRQRTLLQGRLAELETSRRRAKLEAEALRAHLAALQQQQQGGGGGEVRPGGGAERGGAPPASRHAEELRRCTDVNEQLAASLLRQAQDRQRHRDVVARLRAELEQLRAEMAATLEQLQRLTESAVEGLGLSPAKPSPRCFVLSDELPVPAGPACASPAASPPPKAGPPSASPSARAPMTGDRALAHQLRVSRQASPTRARGI